ncbi:MAG TPA: MEDS domain-containing protein [Candidatus Thermoplasmatota archaeon]|nr:MEDS domain-containing protein [Candidatus Thermoplasmatota archaeon]
MPGTDAVGLSDGDHACILFHTDEEHRQVIGKFLAEGVHAGQRVLNIPCAHTPGTMRAYLQENGVDCAAAEAAGQLSFLDAHATYTPGGRFDPDLMVNVLMRTLGKALEAGWDGMRGSGDMSWALDRPPGFERLLEYEAKLNDAIPGSRFRAICQYDTRKFPAETLLEVLATHPIAFVGTRRFDNFYYMPAEEYLSDRRPDHQLRRWLQNIASAKEAEQRRQQAAIQQELLRRAQDDLAAKAAFINMAAHELATPLTPIGVQVQVLENADPDSPLRDRARNIAILRRGFHRMRDTVNQLLHAARANDSTLAFQTSRIDVHDVARQCADAFEETARAKRVTLQVTGKPAWAEADASRLAHAIDNLLSNALAATAAGGTVTLEVAGQDGGCTVRVLDAGTGFDPAEAARLFEPFGKMHPAQGAAGAGLGLYVSKRIIDHHGGRIWAKPLSPGPGSEFGFWIPSGHA